MEAREKARENMDEANSEAQPGPSGGVEFSGWRLAIVFLCLSILLLLSMMDETIVSTALVAISTHLPFQMN